LQRALPELYASTELQSVGVHRAPVHDWVNHFRARDAENALADDERFQVKSVLEETGSER